MTERTIVITGASDGIGAAAARRLGAAGEQVVIVGRSPEKTRDVAAELDAPFFLADFTDLAQVRVLAADLLDRFPRIDVLANNAGGIMGAREETVDGHEKTFQVNHLAPFLLTTLLLDRLLESGASVVNTSSVAHRLFAHLHPDDLDSRRHYRAARAYGNAKLANILFARELHRRYHDQGLRAVSFHPGTVASSFSSESGSLLLRAIYGTGLSRVLLVPPEKGADELVRLAFTRADLDWQSGGYYVGARVGRTSRAARDAGLARELWERSAAMVAADGRLTP